MGAALFILSLLFSSLWFSQTPELARFVFSLPAAPIEFQRLQAWPPYAGIEALKLATPPTSVLVFHKEARHTVHHSRYYLWPRKVLEFHQFDGRDLPGPIFHVTGEKQKWDSPDLQFTRIESTGSQTLGTQFALLPPSTTGPPDPFLARRPGGKWWWCLCFLALLWKVGGKTRSAFVFASVCSALLWTQWNVTPLGFDSIAIWMQKAKNLAVTWDPIQLVQNSPPTYAPPLLPILVALLGMFGETAGHLVNLGFLFLLLHQARRLIRGPQISSPVATGLALSLLLVPAVFLHAYNTMANLPLTALLVCAAAQLKEGRLHWGVLVALSLIRLEGAAVVGTLLLLDRQQWSPKRLLVFLPLALWLGFAHWAKEPSPLNPLPLPYSPEWGKALWTYLERLADVSQWGLLPGWALAALIARPRSQETTRALLLLLAAGWTLAATIATARWGNAFFFQSFDRYFLPTFALAFCYAATWAGQARLPLTGVNRLLVPKGAWSPLTNFLNNGGGRDNSRADK